MFGRRTDDSGGGNRNGDDERPRDEPETSPTAERETDESVFADGIRVDESRRRPRASEAESAGDEEETRPPTVTRYSEPIPAVPPTAGGAHRSAAYRQAPSEALSEEQGEVQSEPPAEPPAETAAPARPQLGEQAMANGDDSKRLTVGQGIRLKGEISNCDSLVVLGNVEADLSGCRLIEVGESGVFNGTVRVEEANIAGQFQGKLVVSSVLSIKSTGKVRGEVRYGALQVEAGGVLAGSADTNDAGAEADGGGDDASRQTFGTRQPSAGDDG